MYLLEDQTPMVTEKGKVSQIMGHQSIVSTSTRGLKLAVVTKSGKVADNGSLLWQTVGERWVSNQDAEKVDALWSKPEEELKKETEKHPDHPSLRGTEKATSQSRPAPPRWDMY